MFQPIAACILQDPDFRFGRGRESPNLTAPDALAAFTLRFQPVLGKLPEI
jgi:hypothetical protein